MPCRSLIDTLELIELRFDQLRISPSLGGYQVVIQLANDPVWVVGLGVTITAALDDAAVHLNTRLNPPRSMFD